MADVRGIPVAPGLAYGRVHVIQSNQDSVPVWTVPEEAVAAEVARLGVALDGVREQLLRQQEIVRKASGEQDAAIFAVHRAILDDPTAVRGVQRRIEEERVNAEWAVQTLIETLHQQLSRLDGDSVRRYAEDMSEPWVLVLDQLLARDAAEVCASQGKVVLAAAELTPQVATFLERERVLAILTEAGGRFSHGAVLARSFGIPCVVGLPNLLARLEQDLEVLVDADLGTVSIRPGAEQVDEFLQRQEERAARGRLMAAASEQPAITTDGLPMGVLVNLESIRDLGTFPVATCDGVGLLRTEFLYMERSQFPSEEDQYRLYRRVVDAMEGRPVVVRTLDIGGDKQLPYFQMPKENNPALGWRGTRVTLEWQDLLRVQLRAILRASAHGHVRLLIPMVTSLEEVRKVREILAGVREQLEAQGYDIAARVELGVMIEVPSAVFVLPELVELVDFVSVGTNDLVQYLLAVDRDNARVSGLYEPHHPAVVRVLHSIAAACQRAGIPCSVCGELAADQAATISLLGMGFSSVSAAPNFLPGLRFAVRNTSMDEARALAQDLLGCRTSREVHLRLAGERRRLMAVAGRSED